MSYPFHQETVSNPPPWWFEGDPRYEAFSPDRLPDGMDSVVLLRVGCSSCARGFKVAYGSPSLREPQLIDPVTGRIENHFWDDPPWHLGRDGYNCIGSTQGMAPLEILEVWQRAGPAQWNRRRDLEGQGKDFGPILILYPFADEIWIADGPPANIAGFRYPTRMAVIRLADGGLFVWSPVALSDGMRSLLAELGPVRHIVAPNSLHHLHLAEWQGAYPEARLYAAPGLAARRPDLAFDEVLGDAPSPAWTGEIDQVAVRGNRITTEIVFFHRASGSAIFTDLIQQFPRGWFPGWRGLVARLDLMTGAEPQVPRKFRIAFSDRGTARAALRRILAWPAEKVLMAHGEPVERDGQAFLARAFRWLKA